MVSVYGPESEQAYGVLSDVSEGGAQFVAGVLFETKSRVLLRIGFNRKDCLNSAVGTAGHRNPVGIHV